MCEGEFYISTWLDYEVLNVWLNIISGYVCMVSEDISTWIRPSKEDILSSVGGIMPCIEGLIEQRQREKEFSFSAWMIELWCGSFPAFGLGPTSSVLLLLRPSGSDTTSLPGSPPGRQTVVLLSLHSCMSHFLVFSLSLSLPPSLIYPVPFHTL